MNRRIRELAHEAGLPTYNPEGIPTKLEKFAQLIVEECLLAISKTDVSLEEVSVMLKCHDQVEKHFGVEE